MRCGIGSRRATGVVVIGVAGCAALLGLTGSLVRARTFSSDATVQYIRSGASLGPFSPIVRVGNVFYLSGQIGVGPDGHLPQDFPVQVRQMMENISTTLKTAGSSFDDVFKCTVMLTDMSRWEEFNKIYATYFKPERLPARSAVGANALAKGASIELECMAYRPMP
jgi:2-iminobutanoate/2-iminopropanoate deaminase